MISNNNFDGFDIIGDVHGCAKALRLLLDRLGYVEGATGFVYHDQSKPRQVLFLGDLIDRGDEIQDTLMIAKTMWDNGNAQVIMGNHELNAIAWHTPFEQGFVRRHDDRAYNQLKATLQQFDHDPELLAYYIQWFKQLPLFLEYPNFRLVHACWDQALIDLYQRLYQSALLDNAVLLDAAKGNHFAECVLERLTQGLSLPLPDKRYMLNQQGFKRHRFRAKFWCEEARYYRDVAFQPAPLDEDIAQTVLTEQDRKRLFLYDSQQKPLFIGHYWLQGQPHLIKPNIACLDYSAVNQGALVAYRMQSDATRLSEQQFVYVTYKDWQ